MLLAAILCAFKSSPSLPDSELTAREAMNSYAKGDFKTATEKYRSIADTYTPEMSDSDAVVVIRSLNNLGYLYHFQLHQPKVAHAYLAQAFDIAEDRNLKRMLPMLYLNMGNLYAAELQAYLYPSSLRKSHEFYRNGFETSITERQDELTVKCFINMVWDDSIFSNPKKALKDIDRFLDMKIPASVPDIVFGRQLAKTLKAMAVKDYKAALATINNIDNTQDNPDSLAAARMNRSLNVIRIWIYQNSLQTDSAIMIAARALREGEEAGSPGERSYMLQRLAGLYSIKGDSGKAREYRHLYLELNDSLLHSNNYDGIIELQYVHDLNRQQLKTYEANASSRIKSITLILCGILLIVLVLFLAVIFRKNRRLKSANDLLFRRTQEHLAASAPIPESAIPETMPGAVQPETSAATPSALPYGLKGKIAEALRNHEILLNPDLTLASLAADLNSNPKYVSQAVNEQYGNSFPNVLSELRVKYFLHKVDEDPTIIDRYTISSLSRQCGFKNQGTFITAFRRITGLNPSEYLRRLRAER